MTSSFMMTSSVCVNGLFLAMKVSRLWMFPVSVCFRYMLLKTPPVSVQFMACGQETKINQILSPNIRWRPFTLSKSLLVWTVHLGPFGQKSINPRRQGQIIYILFLSKILLWGGSHPGSWVSCGTACHTKCEKFFPCVNLVCAPGSKLQNGDRSGFWSSTVPELLSSLEGSTAPKDDRSLLRHS